MYAFFEGRERVLHVFEGKIFLIKSKSTCVLNFDHFKLKILSPKQMLQRLSIALAQVKAGKFIKWNQKNCLFFVSIQKKSKKVCNDIAKSIQTYKNGYYIYEFRK